MKKCRCPKHPVSSRTFTGVLDDALPSVVILSGSKNAV